MRFRLPATLKCCIHTKKQKKKQKKQKHKTQNTKHKKQKTKQNTTKQKELSYELRLNMYLCIWMQLYIDYFFLSCWKLVMI